jgi:protein TonB
MRGLDSNLHSPLAVGADPFATHAAGRQGALSFALVAGLHVAAIFGLLQLAGQPEVRDTVEQIYVRLVEPPPEPAVAKPERPQPPARTELRRPEPPPPVLTTSAEAAAPASFVVAPQPPAPPHVEPVPPPPVPPVVVAARFDADYLHNPKPAYPAISRRLNEEGTTVLRVQVGADGRTLSVDIRQSSGYPRLDEAARDTVSRWRFVPARRGEEAIESVVAVPIVFKLER